MRKGRGPLGERERDGFGQWEGRGERDGALT